nr:ribonuclease H-like domain-containing protein [Tanacetum cinerariifolium]
YGNVIEEGAANIYNLITGADTEEASTTDDAEEFALMGVTSEVHNCPFGCENKPKLDNHLVQTKKWRNSSKNLFRLIDSSMYVRIKVGLGFNDCIRENELGWDDSSFSVFTTNSEDVEGRPLFNRFAKADSIKAVPPPLYGDYTSLSDHIDLDKSQMSYGTKSSTFYDSKFVSNDFISCDDSHKSLEVNTNDFASSDSSVKSSEPKPNDTTSCASTSCVSTSENEDENENTSRTSCNKNGYFNKKARHFRKHASSISKLCFVCGSGTHLIKDCDFYEKQMANKTVGIGVGPVNSRNKVNHQNQFVPQAILLRTGKVNIPPARPQPVPTGKPKVFAPVPTGRPNRPFLVPTDRGYSPSENPFLAAEDEGIFKSGCSKRMTDTECLVLSKDFKLPDDSMVVLKVPRKHNLYTINLNNLCPRGNLACLVVHASFDESVKWHRRMGHVNYKNMNRFCWVLFLEHKDETYPILKDFINLVENQLNKKVKAIRCDNVTEFKNAHMIDLYGSKRIKMKYSNPPTAK